ncbi:MAG: hypothetical protein MRQ07_03815 [Candidatus Midichloria sp.]|nr:hypothetical protein [Candidatus Midichloria sp.]
MLTKVQTLLKKGLIDSNQALLAIFEINNRTHLVKNIDKIAEIFIERNEYDKISLIEAHLNSLQPKVLPAVPSQASFRESILKKLPLSESL